MPETRALHEGNKNSFKLMKNFEEALKVIKERDVPLSSLTLASMLASLNELGLLNQGTVGVLSKYFTPRILAYFVAHGLVDPKKGIEENLKVMFSEYGYSEDEYEVEANENSLKISVVTKRCKICPKGVGGAELEGAACPLPYMVAAALTLMDGREWRPKLVSNGGRMKAVVKEDERCVTVIERT
ncbi:hypothetical protein [Ignicoccus hospitalis]|uniref:4-vinyl reductase 4VR domain-containing protein n=1 Tax=Ignicoccus hospitalis (strain KIN4/I / DSM 18386 / JCM 14125) TaxID=453591 RepID=A8ABM9_IGNH4|nr:hypothetical protein [Ignicoccus hospitalis]ABU82331.1 hypothetical protein Igni_1154 [Ignicoccus hospitalis KIN4/I]HIH89731.1 hypothetical protein [Desulfurococcaceae archaeon]